MADLAERHRRQQLAIRAATLRELQRLWPGLNPRRLEETFPAWLAAVAALIRGQRHISVAVAVRYLRAERAAAGLPGVPPIVLPPQVDREQLEVSLRATAVAPLARAMSRGVPLREARTNAFVSSSGAASRYVLNGGRDTIVETVWADDDAVGFARVGSRSPCAFCAMLISRGAVYRSRETASFRAHDKCGCTPRAVYDPSLVMSPQAEKLSAQFSDATRGLSGKAAVSAWQRHWRAST